MDNNTKNNLSDNNEITNDKINIENNINSNINNNISNDNFNVLKNSLNELDILDKINNFNIDENEEEDDEEQNDAYIQELIKQGKYSDVIKFLDSKDKKIKTKKNADNKNEENNVNIKPDEDEELYIIPADDISDLHEDNNNLNDEKIINDDKDNNNSNDNNLIKYNYDESNKNNQNLENEKNKINKNNENVKAVNINDNKNNNNNINININDGKEKENLIEKKINFDPDVNKEIKQNFNEVNCSKENENKNENEKNNKNSLINNFVENAKKDNNDNKDNNNNNNENPNPNQKNIIKNKQIDDMMNNTKEINKKTNINESKESNESNNEYTEKNKLNNIKENTTVKNENKNKNMIPNNNKNSEEEIINKNKDENETTKPKDIIKDIIAKNNNNNNKLKKVDSSNSLNSSSMLRLSYEEDEENNKYLEERLKDIQEQRKIFVEQTSPEQNVSMSNVELLTKELEELNELENNENEDLNGIEQMNEIYIMVQEDKQSLILQEKVREKLFPFYNKANFDMNDIIKNDFFKSINSIRNFSISKILENKNKNGLKKKNNFNIDCPKSIFDNLKFDKSDIKSGLDYDEYLDEFLEEKNNKNNKNGKNNKNAEKIIKNNNTKVEKIFLQFKNKQKEKNTKKDNNNKMNNIKPIKIFLNKKTEEKNNNNNIKDNNKEKYEINLEEIYNKYKEESSKLCENNNIDLKKYNNFFVDNFNKKHEVFNFNDYSIDLDLDDEIKKELTNNNKNNQNNIEDKDKENYYLKINNCKTFNESILNNYSLLRFINLENNNLVKFPDFSKCPFVYSINMNNNRINKIDRISSLKYLEKLSLNNNIISSIENCNNNKRLRFLFLGHNNISNIDNIANEVPFIEEIILSQNNINYLPNTIYLPYLKFCDLNENKISCNSTNHRLLYFICPSLEKLLLLGNNLDEVGTQFLIKYCPRLKEIDLSFNKFNSIIELIKLLSINSHWNNNLEMINVVGNIFYNSNKNKEIFYLLAKRFCPSIKYINNEEIKNNKMQIYINPHNNIYIDSNNGYSLLNCNLNESFVNIYNSQNYFMKYFTSVYFTNKIFNIYNININNNLKTSNAELFLHINQSYFQSKLSHFISQININKSDVGFFSFDNFFQFDSLLTYLYKFKNRMMYITHSIPILVKRTLFRRMKIIKIQQHYKLRILRKKLAAIVIPDDEYDHAEDLLDFFNSDGKNENDMNEKMVDIDIDVGLDKKMKEIEKNIEKNMKNKKSKSNYQFLEVIKEEDKDKDIDIQNIQKKPNINQNDIINSKSNYNYDLDIIKQKENKNREFNNNIKLNGNIDLDVHSKIINNNINHNNNNKINNFNGKKEIISSRENHKEKDSLVMKLLSNPKYNNNNKLNPIRLTPISKNANSNSIQSSTNIANNNNNYNYQNIDLLKKGLAPNGNTNSKSNSKINVLNDFSLNVKTRYPHKIIMKDDKNYGKFYDINTKSNLPKNNQPIPGLVSGKKREQPSSMKRPESNGVFLPSINNNKLNVSQTTMSNETKSIYSNVSTGKRFLKAGKQKEILLLEQECREAIEKAKVEWGFTNKEVEKILVKKIQKNYQKKIEKLLYKHNQ